LYILSTLNEVDQSLRGCNSTTSNGATILKPAEWVCVKWYAVNQKEICSCGAFDRRATSL